MILGEQYNHSGKKYIDVAAIFRSDGRLEPVSIIWEDGRVFEIDMITDVRSKFTWRRLWRAVYLPGSGKASDSFPGRRSVVPGSTAE